MVVWLEGCRFPRPCRDHVGSQVRFFLGDVERKLAALGDFEGDHLLRPDEFALLELSHNLGLVGSLLGNVLELLARLVGNQVFLWCRD